MITFIFRRISLLIPMLFLVSLFVFGILHVGKNDPAMSYARLSRIPPTDAALAEIRKELGVDKPLIKQYINWVQKALKLDFGKSFVTGNPVLNDILYYLPATLKLTAVSFILTIFVSIPFGVFAAQRKNSIFDYCTRAFSFIGVSVPSFFLGFILVYFFSVKIHWLPPMGRGTLVHYLMPSIALSSMSIAIMIRFVRTNMLDVQNQRFVLYCRVRGVKEHIISWKHMLRHSMIPIVTVLGLHLGELLGGAVVVESIFAWPGVGRYAVSAIFNRDFPVMQCFILLMTCIFVTCNLISDIVYAWIDPRIRLSSGQQK